MHRVRPPFKTVTFFKAKSRQKTDDPTTQHRMVSIGGMVVHALRQGGGLVANTGTRSVRISVLRSSCGVIAKKKKPHIIDGRGGGDTATMSQSAVLPPRRRFQSSGVVRHLLSQQSAITSNEDPATIVEGGTTMPTPIIKAVNNIISTNNKNNLHHHPRIKYSTIITEETPQLLLVPKSLLLLLAKNQNGIKASGDDSFVVTAKDYNGRAWFHATYTDSNGEVFMSGLAQQVTIPTTTTATKHPPSPQASSSSSSSNTLFTTLKPPLHLAETKIFDGKVYYSRIKMAEHAAAARAIDCYIHRENNLIVPNAAEEGGVSCQSSNTTVQQHNKVPQLCFETPYSTIEEGISQNPINYDTLLSIKPMQHVAEVTMLQRPNFTKLANTSPFLLHVPKAMLNNALQMCNIDCAGSFTVHKHDNSSSLIDDERIWYTATFTHPITREIFTSGLSREVFVERRTGASINPPLHMVDATVIDDKVYYCNDDSKLAEHAAAARAIDCYLYREEKEKEEAGNSMKWRLCYEEPYRTPEEGEDVTIDYNTLLVERNTNISNNKVDVCKEVTDNSNNSSQSLSMTPTTGRSFSFSGSAKRMSHSLHVPKTFLSKAFSNKHNVNISDDCYHVKEREYDDITWYTSTFTDPNTLEQFNSGLGNLLRVKSHPDSTDTTTPLHIANVKIFDGEVYYSESILAQHAAAARAIDCYIYREGGVNDRGHHKFCNNFKLCMEAPYGINDGERGVYYASLLQKRDVLSMINEAALFDVDFTGLTEDDEHATIKIRSSKVEEGLPMSSIDRSFSYSVRHMPHDFHVPMEFLSIAYLQKYYRKYGSSTTYYNVIVRECDDERWYTAIFTDPCTNEQFASGLGNIVNVKSRPNRMLKTPLYQADVKVLDGVVYYNDEKLAKHAAAARAIDCYLLREQCVDGIRLCLEDPYSTAEDGVSQSVDYDALLLQKDKLLANDDNDTITDTVPMESFIEGRSISRKARLQPFFLHVPKDFLNSSFSQKYGIFCGDCYEVKLRTNVGDRKWFTATFTDPITKERFSSALGNIVNVKSRPGTTLKTPLYLANVKIVDGEVYYSETRLAEHAAAARAIDCYIYREDDFNNNVDRLCLEEPYTLKEGVIPITDYEALLNKRNKLCTNEFERHKLLIEVEAGKEESRNPCKRDENPMNEVKIYELDSSDDDLPVLTIPFVNGVNKVVKVNSTMERILEIWTETTTGHNSSSEQLYSKSKRQHESPSARIRSILNWYERVNNDPKSKEEAFALARLCNKILTALGEANCDKQLEGKDCVNMQKNAKTILDKIISLSISFDDKSDESLVDADTFTAYIRCLNRANPAYSAELAELLLKSLQSKEYYQGINLPLPNVDTFNAVIGLWGLVDGVTGQSCANRVYSLLDSASMTRNEEHPLHPNEETVRLLMSVNSKKESQFSFEHAKSCLQSFPNLVADVNFYSAALSTLSTNTSSDSLDPRYSNSWISYGRQYVRGFKSAETSSEEEAEEIAKWLLYAEECGIHPNVDMYEAVIRAWIKTGTKDGLLSAEDWAKRAVSSNSRIRIETFHPIIAAWALCQFERAPARVEEWTNQLTGLSATKPHLKPDLQTLSALIISWRNVQAGIIARANEKTLSDSIVLTTPRGDSDEKSRILKDVEMVFTSAENCMQHLTDLYPRSKLDDVHDTMAMNVMFTHTIEAWGCASRFAQLYSSMGSASLDTSHGVHEMLKVHRLLDAKIEKTIDTDEEDVLTTLQLMGESYAETIAQLHQIDTALDSEMIATTATTTPFFSREIADVERMLYEYDLYSRTHYPEGNFTLESNALRHRLYKEILRGCAGVKSSADYGHVIRLCRLIMDQLSWLDERCLDNNNNSGNTNGKYTSFVKDDITDIFVDMALLAGTTIPNEHERTYVLSVMWNNAKHFFEWNSSRYDGGSSRYDGGSSSNSNYATVDKARLIGAMRMAMSDSELTEPFLRNFDERPPKKKGRGNTWLAFVEDILRKGD